MISNSWSEDAGQPLSFPNHFFATTTTTTTQHTIQTPFSPPSTPAAPAHPHPSALRARRCPPLRRLELALITVVHRLKTGLARTLCHGSTNGHHSRCKAKVGQHSSFSFLIAHPMSQWKDPRRPRRPRMHGLPHCKGRSAHSIPGPALTPSILDEVCRRRGRPEAVPTLQEGKRRVCTFPLRPCPQSHPRLAYSCVFEKHRRGRKPGSK